MANPKRRHSNTRTQLRRAHDHLTPRSMSQCPKCGTFILPHRVCTSCGFYKGKQVITIKVKSKVKE
ncbi:MAG TPA: 50S ribosomal protein L32 [Candidatus Omnitrophota bacterium]|nr:50S ribosomal protein L32 [Candidatus Omnitrophota bacterium]HPS37484.1 50S ribosomal protein L32 [Candidatus Omnitrophota bacterium]